MKAILTIFGDLWYLDCVCPIHAMQVYDFAMSDELQSGAEAEQHSWSIGSKLHAQGGCKPCAWFWRPGGCHRGDDCKHCHLCPPGALQMRKRQNRELMKALRQQRKVQYETRVPGASNTSSTQPSPTHCAPHNARAASAAHCLAVREVNAVTVWQPLSYLAMPRY